MKDTIIQRSVGLRRSRWEWLDELALASGQSTSQLIRDVIESFVLASVAPAVGVGRASPADQGCNGVAVSHVVGDSTERAAGSDVSGGASFSPEAA